MRLAIVGLGEVGIKHLECLRSDQGADVLALFDNSQDKAWAIGARFGVPFCSSRFEDILSADNIDAIVLCTPVHEHADQTIAALRSGKHVMVDTALANSLQSVEEIAAVHRETRRAVMAGHTHRYSPSHQWIHRRVLSGELHVQQIVVEGHFLQSGVSDDAGGLGNVSELLWSYAVAGVDLLQYQTGHKIAVANAVEGAAPSDRGQAVNLGIQLLTTEEEIGMVSLRFNSGGAPGISFCYVCDRGVFVARGDHLFDRTNSEPIELDSHSSGIELQDREFLDAVAARRKPATGISDVIDCYRVLCNIDEQLVARRLPVAAEVAS